jgi:malonyl-CoA O-methyltransferase
MSRQPLLEPREAYALWATSYPAHAHNPVMRAEERAMLGLMPGALRG